MSESNLALPVCAAQISPAEISPAQMSNEAFYGLFLASQSSEQTRRGYDGSVRDFAAFLGSADGRALGQYDVVRLLRGMNAGQAHGILTGYRVHLTRTGKQPATINVRLAAIRSLVQEAKRNGLLDYEIDVKGVRSRNYRDTAGPGFDRYQQMLAKVELRGDTKKAHRDRAILHLLHDSALRRGEIVRCDLADVDLTGPLPTIAIIGKGTSEKVKLVLPPASFDAMKQWIDVRGNEPGPLFHNLDHSMPRGRLTGKSIYTIVQEYGGKGVRPHGLRHSAITRAAEKTNGNLVKMAKFSRHRNMNTLRAYLDNLRDENGAIASLVSEPDPATPQTPVAARPDVQP